MVTYVLDHHAIDATKMMIDFGDFTFGYLARNYPHLNQGLQECF